MVVCVGRGPDGEHCCQFSGVCQFYDDGCTLFKSWGRLVELPEWQAAPVGRWFAKNHPGFECRDWPQNIPAVMNNPALGKCCWEEAS